MTEKRKKTAGQGKVKVLLAKPGLDGHDIGMRVVASKLRQTGMEVVYLGLFQTEKGIVNSALQEDVDIIGLSFHADDHLVFIPAVMDELKRRGISIPIVVGGIIPDEDFTILTKLGVKAIFQPWSPLEEIANKIHQIVSQGRVKVTNSSAGN
jgi:methylmalonyl-CoA mutase C-terminal domain/subunit